MKDSSDRPQVIRPHVVEFVENIADHVSAKREPIVGIGHFFAAPVFTGQEIDRIGLEALGLEAPPKCAAGLHADENDAGTIDRRRVGHCVFLHGSALLLWLGRDNFLGALNQLRGIVCEVALKVAGHSRRVVYAIDQQDLRDAHGAAFKAQFVHG